MLEPVRYSLTTLAVLRWDNGSVCRVMMLAASLFYVQGPQFADFRCVSDTVVPFVASIA